MTGSRQKIQRKIESYSPKRTAQASQMQNGSEKSLKTNTLVVRLVTVGIESAGQRLDNFLIREVKGVPKSHIYRVVRDGQVRVNKARVKVDTRLEEGDVVRIPPMRVAEKTTPAQAPVLAKGDIPTILYEDEHLLVLDKPAGMASHGGSGIAFGLIERIRATRPHQKFLELAHRLDRDTSGAIILVKTRKALVTLHERMREGGVQKTYLTLVKGDWVNDRQHVKFPLHKYVSKSGERRVRVDYEKGLASHSIFRLLNRFGLVSLLEVDLKTGRTHQIRVHAVESGHPLVGDDKYGDFDFNDQVEKGLLGQPFKRMFLHAARLSFTHPITNERLTIDCPLPSECQSLVDCLKNAK